jgi:hypothetical protein
MASVRKARELAFRRKDQERGASPRAWLTGEAFFGMAGSLPKIFSGDFLVIRNDHRGARSLEATERNDSGQRFGLTGAWQDILASAQPTRRGGHLSFLPTWKIFPDRTAAEKLSRTI